MCFGFKSTVMQGSYSLYIPNTEMHSSFGYQHHFYYLNLKKRKKTQLLAFLLQHIPSPLDIKLLQPMCYSRPFKTTCFQNTRRTGGGEDRRKPFPFMASTGTIQTATLPGSLVGDSRSFSHGYGCSMAEICIHSYCDCCCCLNSASSCSSPARQESIHLTETTGYIFY